MKLWQLTLALLLGLLISALILLSSFAYAAEPSFIVVQWGDTLYSLAARYHTSVNALVSANRLPSASFIYAGQRLVVPGTAPAPRPATKSL